MLRFTLSSIPISLIFFFSIIVFFKLPITVCQRLINVALYLRAFFTTFYYSSLQTPLICERLQVEAGLIARPPTEVRSDVRGGEVNQLCALKASGPHRHAACFKQTNGFL